MNLNKLHVILIFIYGISCSRDNVNNIEDFNNSAEQITHDLKMQIIKYVEKPDIIKFGDTIIVPTSNENDVVKRNAKYYTFSLVKEISNTRYLYYVYKEVPVFSFFGKLYQGKGGVYEIADRDIAYFSELFVTRLYHKRKIEKIGVRLLSCLDMEKKENCLSNNSYLKMPSRHWIYNDTLKMWQEE